MSYDSRLQKSACTTVAEETHGELIPSFGSLPKDLQGTLFATGPGRFHIEGQRYENPFEGDGLVTAVTFSNGRAHFRNRFVLTKRLVATLKSKKPPRTTQSSNASTRGAWAAALIRRGGGEVANRGVIHWGRTAIAMWDGDKPLKIDPKNIETYFPLDLKGVLGDSRDAAGVMSGKVRVDAEKGRLIKFGYDASSKVCIREFDWLLRCGRTREEAIPGGFTLLNDFAITERYYVFSVAPMSIDKISYKLGVKNADAAIKQTDAPTILLLIPRTPDTKQQAISIPVDPHLCWSFANAYDTANGDVIIDMLRQDPFSTPAPGGPSANDDIDAGRYGLQARQLVRYTVDVKGKTGKMKPLGPRRHADYATVPPSVGGRQHRYVYMGVAADETGGAGPIQGIARVDTESDTSSVWLAEATCLVGCVTYLQAAASSEASEGASKDAEKEKGWWGTDSNLDQAGGYVTAIVTDAASLTSEFVILKASNIEAGPICRAPISTNIPPGASSWFTCTPEAAWSVETLEKSFQLANLFKRKGWNEAKSDFSSLGLNALLED